MPKKKSENEEKLNLSELKAALDNAERQLRLAKQLIFGETYKEKAKKLDGNGGVVEGIFDGENMIGPDSRSYSVPPNYASKSKLVPGDAMKLTISSEGGFTFKQIKPVERIRVTGRLSESDGNYCVDCAGKIYQVLAASVSFFKAKDGDRVTLLVARDEECNWGAMDNVIVD